MPARQRLVGWRRARDLLPARTRLRLVRAFVGLRRGVPETVEQAHLLLAVAADRVVGRQVAHELLDTCADLVRKVRRRGPDEGVDLLDARHGRKPTPDSFTS